jgi:lipid A oxidase
MRVRSSEGETVIIARRIGKLAVTAGLAGALFAVDGAHANLRLSAYGGVAETLDTDVEFEQDGGTALTLNDISWDNESFQSPIYYGLRLSYWFDRAPSWGLGLDFTHAKMIADTDQIVTVNGTRAGMSVAGRERLGETFSNLQLSHGHNLLTLNALYRLFPVDRFETYIGLGIGAAIPHVETEINGIGTSEYQLAGAAAQGLLGVNVGLVKHLSAFIEYKLSYADIDADLQGGSSLHVEPWTNHFILGLSLSFF